MMMMMMMIYDDDDDNDSSTNRNMVTTHLRFVYYWMRMTRDQMDKRQSSYEISKHFNENKIHTNNSSILGFYIRSASFCVVHAI
jgi:hypothetical protein